MNKIQHPIVMILIFIIVAIANEVTTSNFITAIIIVVISTPIILISYKIPWLQKEITFSYHFLLYIIGLIVAVGISYIF